MPFRFADALFWVAVACCSIAQLAILRSIVISQAPSGETRAPARRAAEIAWAILPGLALAAVLVFTWRAMNGGDAAAAAAMVSRP